MQTTIDTAAVQSAGLELGLDAVGVCAAEPYSSTESDILNRRAKGLFADLRFTMAQPEVSCHPELLVENARSVISCALCYWRPDRKGTEGGGRLARYTRWDSYAALRERLEQLAELLRGAGHSARVLVDANHHVDREAAARSGVGFYGKNTNVITRRHGSWVVLGTIVTSAALQTTEPLRPGCGSCTLCIDACPTDALVEPGVLDTGACLSYWTQTRHDSDVHIREALGDMVYGCDICQDVCPWNASVPRRHADEEPVDATVSLQDWLGQPDEQLDAEYQRLFIPRRQVRYLRRNALVAMGNRKRVDDLPVVAAFLEHEDEMLREHARWAVVQIAGPQALTVLQEK